MCCLGQLEQKIHNFEDKYQMSSREFVYSGFYLEPEKDFTEWRRLIELFEKKIKEKMEGL